MGPDSVTIDKAFRERQTVDLETVPSSQKGAHLVALEYVISEAIRASFSLNDAESLPLLGMPATESRRWVYTLSLESK
jgi:hypothetical protein